MLVGEASAVEYETKCTAWVIILPTRSIHSQNSWHDSDITFYLSPTSDKCCQGKSTALNWKWSGIVYAKTHWTENYSV